MPNLSLPVTLEDKIFEIKESDTIITKIVSYFPLSKLEKQKITTILNRLSFDEFYSIFNDTITDEEWNRTKEQIKKKFKDELFDIDKL